MIKHVVLVKIKPDTAREKIDAMVAGYNSMKNAIPELVSWSMGPNLRGDDEYTRCNGRRRRGPGSLETLCGAPAPPESVNGTRNVPIFEMRVIGDYEFDPEAEPCEPQVKTVWTELVDMVRPEHTALIVIDVQNDFCASGGARMKGISPRSKR